MPRLARSFQELAAAAADVENRPAGPRGLEAFDVAVLLRADAFLAATELIGEAHPVNVDVLVHGRRADRRGLIRSGRVGRVQLLLADQTKLGVDQALVFGPDASHVLPQLLLDVDHALLKRVVELVMLEGDRLAEALFLDRQAMLIGSLKLGNSA